METGEEEGMSDPRVDPEVGAVVWLWGERVEVTGRTARSVEFRGRLHNTPMDMPYMWDLKTWRKTMKGAEVRRG